MRHAERDYDARQTHNESNLNRFPGDNHDRHSKRYNSVDRSLFHQIRKFLRRHEHR